MTITDCRSEVRAFACLMEERLRANDHKQHWRGCSLDYLMSRLDEEIGELQEVIDIYEECGEDPPNLADEAADTANFAMMIADVCGALKAVTP